MEFFSEGFFKPVSEHWKPKTMSLMYKDSFCSSEGHVLSSHSPSALYLFPQASHCIWNELRDFKMSHFQKQFQQPFKVSTCSMTEIKVTFESSPRAYCLSSVYSSLRRIKYVVNNVNITLSVVVCLSVWVSCEVGKQ